MATHSSILAWKNPMDRGNWQAIVHGVTKSQTQLSIHAHFTTGQRAEGGGSMGEAAQGRD